MSFYHEVLKDIASGKVPLQFRVKDLSHSPVPGKSGHFKIGDVSYKESTLLTWPANYSIGPNGVQGQQVQQGRTPAFFRLEVGLYTPIEECEAGETVTLFSSVKDVSGYIEEPEAEILSTVQLAPAAETKSRTAPEIIAESIARRPFQVELRKQRCTYPKQPAKGWGARLEAYFWPKLENNWAHNQSSLQAMYQQAEAIETELRERRQLNPMRLSRLFDDVCAWGGVRRPSVEDDALATQAEGALAAIDQGEVPEQGLAINSAWTKLYAMLRPGHCVIFDSRVATALIAALDPYIEQLKDQKDFVKNYKGLGTVQQGRGGTRPRAFSDTWTNGYQKWDAQLAANHLCCEIRDYLNIHHERSDFAKPDGTPWTLREVEAVLFMDGY
ncbi:MAG: hypothetical protein HWE39_10025 [Oceanospirillaceae bacterium]|nr:hypothetical protein [Oceanospirillaceae bacterium]